MEHKGLTLTQALPIVREYIQANVPVNLAGAPGLGKSALIAQIAAADFAGELTDLRASMLDPVDVRGLPYVENGVARWSRPCFVPAPDDMTPRIIFFDELTNAPMSVQAALYQFILDRKAGDHVIPEPVRIVAAGNRVKDRAAAGKMSSALANRMAHIEIVADLESWLAWAAAAGVHPLAIAFLRFRPELLHVMPGEKAEAADKGRTWQMSPDAVAFPTPRSWAQAAKFMDSPNLFALARGLVGEGPAAELRNFVQMFATLPPLDSIIANPTTAAVPQNMGALYALASGLARKATHGNFAAIADYVNRMPPEFRALFDVDAKRRDPEITNAPGYTRFAVANQGIAA